MVDTKKRFISQIYGVIYFISIVLCYAHIYKGTLVSNATSKRVCLKLVTKQDPLGRYFYFLFPHSLLCRVNIYTYTKNLTVVFIIN